MALAFSTACSPCNAMGPGRPPYKLPIAVAAIPQCAMAQSGSFWAMAINASAAAGNEKVCSVAGDREMHPAKVLIGGVGLRDRHRAVQAKHEGTVAQVRGGFEYPSKSA